MPRIGQEHVRPDTQKTVRSAGHLGSHLKTARWLLHSQATRPHSRREEEGRTQTSLIGKRGPPQTLPTMSPGSTGALGHQAAKAHCHPRQHGAHFNFLCF